MTSLVESFKPENTSYHDYLAKLRHGGQIALEIQITNYGRHDGEGFRRYGDVRLDLISAFEASSKECQAKYHLKNGVWKSLQNASELAAFEKVCAIQRWGKLKTCDAELFVFAVVKRRNQCGLIHLYDNAQLKHHATYFVDRYGVKINHKQGEGWGSAFVPVPVDDSVLQSCRIKDPESFMRLATKKAMH